MLIAAAIIYAAGALFTLLFHGLLFMNHIRVSKRVMVIGSLVWPLYWLTEPGKP